MAIWIIWFHFSYIAFLQLYQSTSCEGLSLSIEKNKKSLPKHETKEDLRISQSGLAAHNPGGAYKLKPRERHRRSSFGDLPNQLLDKGTLVGARGAALTSEFYNAVFPHPSSRVTNISRLSSGTDHISYGIDSIEKAINAFADKNSIPSTMTNQFEHFDSVESIDSQALGETFLKSDAQRNKHDKLFEASVKNGEEAKVRSSPISKKPRQSKIGIPHHFIDTDDFIRDRDLNSIPPFAVATGQNHYSLNGDVPGEIQRSSLLNAPIIGKTSQTNSDTLNSVIHTHTEVPHVSGTVHGENGKSVDTQQVRYKDAYVIHPANTPSHYPSYPVYESTHVTSDMTVLATLLRNLHATERRAHSLLDKQLV